MQHVTKNIVGFVAEFRDQKGINKAIEKNSVSIPEGWINDVSNFSVISDLGRQLEIAFWDFEKDVQVGEETLTVDFDDVMTWA